MYKYISRRIYDNERESSLKRYIEFLKPLFRVKDSTFAAFWYIDRISEIHRIERHLNMKHIDDREQVEKILENKITILRENGFNYLGVKNILDVCEQIELYNIDVGGVSNMGAVYLVESLGIYKIGYTKDLRQRLSGLKTSNPHGIELVKYVKHNNPPKLESLLHGLFDHKRCHREWFNLSEEELKKCISVMEDNQASGSLRKLNKYLTSVGLQRVNKSQALKLQKLNSIGIARYFNLIDENNNVTNNRICMN